MVDIHPGHPGPSAPAEAPVYKEPAPTPSFLSEKDG